MGKLKTAFLPHRVDMFQKLFLKNINVGVQFLMLFKLFMNFFA